MSTPQPSILVVEDDPTTAILLNRILTGQGYRVRVASTGDDGLEEFLREPCDLVVTDYNIPTLNGAELFRRLRAKHPGLRVILCSGEVDPSLVRDLRKEGLFDFLQKPCNPTHLLEAVAKALGR